MPLRNIILPFFILVLTTQCTDKRNDKTDSYTKINYKPLLDYNLAHSLIHPASYTGEWTYSFLFYGSELSINRNGTFKFHQQGCLGHGYSEGRWITNGPDIFLTSFAKYAKFSLADTSNVYFYNGRYRLEGDILYRFHEHGSRSDAFILTKSL